MDRLYDVLVRWQDRLLARGPRLRRLVVAWWHCRYGHSDTLIVRPPNMWVECTTCGRRTPGLLHGPIPVSGGRRWRLERPR